MEKFLLPWVRRRPSGPARPCLATNLTMFKIRLSNHPRGAHADLLARQNTLNDELPNGGHAKPQFGCCFFNRRLASLRPFAFAIDRDIILLPQQADTSSCPTIAVAGRLSGSIQHRGDNLIWHLAGERANQIDHLSVGCPTSPSYAVLPYAQSSMIASLPMNNQIQGVIHDVDDDF